MLVPLIITAAVLIAVALLIRGSLSSSSSSSPCSMISSMVSIICTPVRLLVHAIQWANQDYGGVDPADYDTPAMSNGAAAATGLGWCDK